jgi:hypothetical protein
MNSRAASARRLTNGSPACVLHQGPRLHIAAAMTVCSLASPHLVVLPAPADATAAGLEGNTDEEMARKAGHQGFVWLDERGSPCSRSEGQPERSGGNHKRSLWLSRSTAELEAPELAIEVSPECFVCFRLGDNVSLSFAELPPSATFSAMVQMRMCFKACRYMSRW